MEDITYLFIDGNYAGETYRKAMNDMFEVDGDLDPANLLCATRFRRAFFYDCPAEKRTDESDADFQVRREKQQAYFDEFKQVNGVHVRLGTLRGRKARQKEVDVLLAVDMMSHGFNRNMTNAILLSGDLDFRPVVDALVRSGIFVQIMYEAESTSRELRESADYAIRLRWQDVYNWGRESFRSANPLPRVELNAPEFFGQIVESGFIRQPGATFNIPAQLIQSAGMWQVIIENWDGRRVAISHSSEPILNRYIAKRFASIEWTGRRRPQSIG